MPGDPFRLARAGEPLRIHARTWNDVRALLRKPRIVAGAGNRRPVEHFQHAEVQNVSETAVDRHRVLSIVQPAILPHDYTVGMDAFSGNIDGFSQRIRVNGDTPAANDQDIVITTEPIRAGEMGRCAVSGAAIALVAIDDEDHTAAGVEAASTMLKSMSRGPCTIIWKQEIADRETEGVALCLVRIVGRRPAGEHFAVLVTQTGGVAGDATTTCTFTYTVKDLYGVEIGTVMSPEKRRQPDTPYLAGATDVPGSAYYDQDGVLHLFDANELLNAEEC